MAACSVVMLAVSRVLTMAVEMDVNLDFDSVDQRDFPLE